MPMLNDWKRTKKEFETLTGKSKPADTIASKFRLSSGLESALKACDAAEKGITTLSGKKEPSEVKLDTAIKAYSGVKNGYLSKLESAINDSKKEIGEDAKIYVKGLKMLKTKLDGYEAHYEEKLAFSKAQVDREKDESYDDKHWKIARVKMKKAILKGRAATAKVKVELAALLKARKAAATDEEAAMINTDAWITYVQDFNIAVRELGWALKDVKKAREKGMDDLPDPAPIEKKLKKLDTVLAGVNHTSPPSLVAQVLKAYNAILKGLITEYALK